VLAVVVVALEEVEDVGQFGMQTVPAAGTGSHGTASPTHKQTTAQHPSADVHFSGGFVGGSRSPQQGLCHTNCWICCSVADGGHSRTLLVVAAAPAPPEPDVFVHALASATISGTAKRMQRVASRGIRLSSRTLIKRSLRGSAFCADDGTDRQELAQRFVHARRVWERLGEIGVEDPSALPARIRIARRSRPVSDLGHFPERFGRGLIRLGRLFPRAWSPSWR
jgi:hypothetical protein